MNGEEYLGEGRSQPGGEWAPGPPPWQNAVKQERGRRRALLRRLAALLGTGTLAFTLTTWMLLRHEGRARSAPPTLASAPKSVDGSPKANKPGGATAPARDEEPLETARAQLDALNRDDIRAAYDLFSARYRSEVPFAVFRKLVTSHRRMFHTEEDDVEVHSQTADRALLNIHVVSNDDEDYVAHFTLVRVNGRWWVDDLRWGYEDGDSNNFSSA